MKNLALSAFLSVLASAALAGGGDAPQFQATVPTNAPYVWTNTYDDVKLGSILLTYGTPIEATCSVYVVNSGTTNLVYSSGSAALGTFVFSAAGTPYQVKKADKVRLVTTTTNAVWTGKATFNNSMLE